MREIDRERERERGRVCINERTIERTGERQRGRLRDKNKRDIEYR